MPRHRTRTSEAFRGHVKCKNNGTGGNLIVDQDVVFENTETCNDDIHEDWQKFGDGGGPFELWSTKYTIQPAHVVDAYSSYERYTTGDILPEYPSGLTDYNDVPSEPSPLALLSMGATAIARTMPTNPEASLAQFVGELRQDGVPRIPTQELRERTDFLRKKGSRRSASKAGRNAGSEYLNVEFGWQPLMADLKDFAHAVKDSHEILDNYVRGSDKKIRRRYAFPTQNATKLWVAGVNGVGGMTAYGGGSVINTILWSGRVQRSVTVRSWFSGAFRYHVPVGNDTLSKMRRYSQEADKLLGLELTPETVWQLEPWTWAIDWFSNAGDIVHNVSRLGRDGLVLQYGYMMSAYEEQSHLYAEVPYQRGAFNAPIVLVPCSRTVESKHLRRVPATPYGFGFDMNSLSASQDAVLVALGLSRGLR